MVVGIEARGFLFGAPVALGPRAPASSPVRKPAKLPRGVVTVTYDLEYGTETLALHADAFGPGTGCWWSTTCWPPGARWWPPRS